MARINKNTMCQESDEDSTVIESIPQFGDELAMAATAGKNSVDGGGDQRQEATGDEEDDPETQEAERTKRGQKSSEKISKILPMGIYSPTLSV